MRRLSRSTRRGKRLGRTSIRLGTRLARGRPWACRPLARASICWEAVTEYGETTVLECGGSFTGEVTIRFLEHLQAEFGEKLVVLLDQATYFTAAAVKDFAADEPIELVYFPTGSPDLNPTEEYWRRLKLALANRYFGSCAEIRLAVWTALESISPPGVYQYLCL
jgi:transposase